MVNDVIDYSNKVLHIIITAECGNKRLWGLRRYWK